MSTFLQLCQKTARDTGVISGVAPTTVDSQTGDLRKVVNFTDEAWRNIQRKHSRWQWMRKYFEDKATIASTMRYTTASWSISDLAEWINDPNDRVYLYLASIGVSDEGAISFLNWPSFNTKYNRGSQTNNRPSEWSVSPQGEFCLGPIPDDVYTVRGPYRQSVQSMAANADVPGLPSDYHDLIAYEAVMLFNGNDEALTAFGDAKRKADLLWPALERDQLPVVTFGGGPVA